MASDFQVPAPGTVLDGSSGRLTGWKPSAMGPDIFEKQVSFQALGVFQDSFDGTDGQGPARGRNAVLWNMATDSNYGSNPNHELHDFDPSHDYYAGRHEDRYKMHGPESQWKQVGSTLYVRTHDGRSPDEYNVRAAVQKVGFSVNGQAGLVLDGVRIRHFGSFTSILNCPGVIVRNCLFEYCGGYGLEIHGSNDALVAGNIIRGGGSGVAHGGQSAYFSNETGLRFLNNDVRFGGHGGPFAKAIQKFLIQGNFFGKAQGSLLNLNYGCSDGVIDNNIFEGAPYQFESLIHKEAHAGIQLIGSRNQIRRNKFHHCGVGLALDCGNGAVSNGNVIEENEFREPELFAIVLEGYNAANRGQVNDNRIVGNSFDGRGQFDIRLDLPAGGSDQWGTKIERNAIPGKVHFFDGGVGDVLAMQAKFPAVMTGNTSTAPPTPPPTPIPPPEPTPPPEPPGEAVQLTSISPNPAKIGDSITLRGSGFGTTPCFVLLPDTDYPGGLRVIANGSTDTQAIVTVPEGVSSGQLRMKTRLGLYSNYLPFTVGDPVPPPPPPPPPPVPFLVTLSAYANQGGGFFSGAVSDAAPLPAGSKIVASVSTPDGRIAMATVTIPGTPVPPPDPIPPPTPPPSGELLPIPTVAGAPPAAPPD
jgi:hypothetical protein